MRKQSLVETLEPKTRAALRIAICETAGAQLWKMQHALMTQGCREAARAVAKARKSVASATRHAHALAARLPEESPATTVTVAVLGKAGRLQCSRCSQQFKTSDLSANASIPGHSTAGRMCPGSYLPGLRP